MAAGGMIGRYINPIQLRRGGKFSPTITVDKYELVKD